MRRGRLTIDAKIGQRNRSQFRLDEQGVILQVKLAMTLKTNAKAWLLSQTAFQQTYICHDELPVELPARAGNFQVHAWIHIHISNPLIGGRITMGLVFPQEIGVTRGDFFQGDNLRMGV